MAIDLNRDRYLYRVKKDEHYGCMTAISMKDAKSIYGSKAEYRKARFDPDVAVFVDHGDQVVKLLAFSGLRTIGQFISRYPNCIKNNAAWMLDSES